MKNKINMFSMADQVEGQGVLSATYEQINLVKNGLNDKFHVLENKLEVADICHYHTINMRYYFCLPFVNTRGKKIGSVHFLPETIENSLKLPKLFKKAFYKYMISFYKKMDYLVTVNPYFIERLKAYGIDEKKITYIPNYVSDELFYKMEDEDKKKNREKYKINSDMFVVLSVGQLQTRKGIFDFVSMAKSMPDVQFIWAGGFSFSKISYGYKEINKIMKNPPKNLKFLGIVKREFMNEIYNLADVMLLASYEELFPMTILESMCCKIPVLLRDLDIYKNILFDFYLKRDDKDGFIDEINKLKNDKSYYEEASLMSEKGNIFYSKNHVLEMWDKFYEGILNEER